MPDFWPTCGYRFLSVTGENRLAVSDAEATSILNDLLLNLPLARVS